MNRFLYLEIVSFKIEEFLQQVMGTTMVGWEVIQLIYIFSNASI